MKRILLVSAVLFLLLAIAPLHGVQTAVGDGVERILKSGDGPIGSRDPANQFTTDGIHWEDAFIVAPHPVYDVIPGTNYINRNPDLSGPEFAATRYRTSFRLPRGFRNPSLTISIHADNVGTIFLNGTKIGEQPFAEIYENFQDPPEAFSTKEKSFFRVGVNFVEFSIYNFHGATAFDYVGSVTFSRHKRRSSSEP